MEKNNLPYVSGKVQESNTEGLYFNTSCKVEQCELNSVEAGKTNFWYWVRVPLWPPDVCGEQNLLYSQKTHCISCGNSLRCGSRGHRVSSTLSHKIAKCTESMSKETTSVRQSAHLREEWSAKFSNRQNKACTDTEIKMREFLRSNASAPSTNIEPRMFLWCRQENY